jgi:superfamily I DNA/RNA helicase
VVLSTTVTRKIFEAQSLDADQHDEERRIEYVGVTRARKRLILTSEADAEYRMQGVA